MGTYKVTLKHDNGVINITTYASSEEAAIYKICEFEGCPISAIKKIRKIN